MSRSKKIAILLSTYNGEQYLEGLLNSLSNQTYQDFELFIGDDGSMDQTKDIIRNHVLKNENTVFFEGNNLGSKHSFESLLQYCIQLNSFAYYMFADQDDIWFPEKIEKTLQKMLSMEHFEEIPILVHTDMVVTDDMLNIICSSFWSYQKLDPQKDQVNRLLVQNVITGCTMMINHSLAKLCLPISHHAIMHDWWIGLIASSLGKVGYLKDATIYYRQHNRNYLGATKFDVRYAVKQINKPFSLTPNILQCNDLYKAYLHLLDADHKNMMQSFNSLTKKNYINRLRIVVKWKFYKTGFLRNIGLVIKLWE